MVGLDTNVLVRYLTRDDESQWQQACLVIEGGQLCFVANIVLCELVWVLRGNPYKFAKEEILNTLEMMLQSPTFEFENRSAVYQAFQRAKQGRADFSDYLIGAIATHAGCQETVSFDRKLKGEKGFRCFTRD
ncbi:PIN domain-containing protein [Chroococcidiopsis sp.]|uniref:PIN domain-containing protein n=1 Tax=Chroococcidiopsis sp. TaxID=3088168 RepID=UPI003F40CF43